MNGVSATWPRLFHGPFDDPSLVDVYTTQAPSRFHSWVLAHERTVRVVLVAVLVLYHAVAIAEFGLGRVDGRLYPLVDDDVMISMRFGQNLARGDGLVYNAGERVEGFTNPLLTLITAALHVVGIPGRMIPGLLMLMNIGISVGVLHLLFRFWGSTPVARVKGLCAGLFYVLLPAHMWYAYAGYEVYMQVAILLYAVCHIDRMRGRDALLLGLLPLTHQTGLVMWAVLVAVCAVVNRPIRRGLWLASLAVLPFAAYELFRIAYYGEILPNTYYLKVGGGTLRGGLVYAVRWGLSVVPAALLAAYAVMHRVSLKRWLMALLILAHTASVIAIGGDIMPQFRFLFVCSALIAALAGAGAAEWFASSNTSSTARGGNRSAAARGPSWALHASAAVAVLIAALAIPAFMAKRDAPQFEMQRKWNVRHVATGLALNENTRPDDVIALFGLGFTGYFADRFTIDMLGKADHHIARLAPKPGRRLAHNKSDVAYVMTRHPRYLELNLSRARLDDIPWLQRWQRDDQYGYPYDLALDPQFRARYDVQLTDTHGRRVPFAAPIADTAVWRMPDAFYDNLESWER